MITNINYSPLTDPFSAPPLWNQGPSPGQLYQFPSNQAKNIPQQPITRTLYPMVTGTSVLGLKCADCVVLAADSLGSYGSMARFRDICRITAVGNNAALACTGDYADFQFLKDRLDEKIRTSKLLEDAYGFKPHAIHSWLTRVLYNRRTKLNPLWNSLVVAGWDDDTPFLGFVDLIGVSYVNDSIGTGLGAYMAQPLMRSAIEKAGGVANLSEEQGLTILSDCMRVLFYRDCRTFPRFHTCVVNKDGVRINEPVELTGDWSVAAYVRGYD